jgi:signal transduction histidine kinase
MNPDNKKRILIVDDQSLILRALTLMLEPLYEITGVLEADQALQAAKSDPQPDLILLDVKMPEIDGYEVCRRLKADQSTQSIPVIFVTAMDRKRDEVQGFEAGAVDYIAKPIVQETLLARVEVHLALQENQKLLALSNNELEEMHQLVNKFIGMTAHDLRGPIASIQAYADVLGSTPQSDPEGAGQYPAVISAACNRMLEHISDTLNVSMVESGELVLRLGASSLADLVTDRVQILEPIAKMKNVELVRKCDIADNSWFDSDRVSRVLDKLITNAIKFSPEGTQVIITLEDVGDHLRVSIMDQGPGLSDEELSGIFDHEQTLPSESGDGEPDADLGQTIARKIADVHRGMLDRFQKLRKKPTDDKPGAHLGLAIAKTIVDAHQGVIMVESEPGKGATFSFSLPKKEVEQP